MAGLKSNVDVLHVLLGAIKSTASPHIFEAIHKHHMGECSHVNKKALDQYTNFTEQREELARRQTENGRGEDKIKQLIQTLDMRKDEAIERTFKVMPAAQAG